MGCFYRVLRETIPEPFTTPPPPHTHISNDPIWPNSFNSKEWSESLLWEAKWFHTQRDGHMCMFLRKSWV